MLELDVGGAGIGDELRLESPGTVRIRGRTRFDPARDDVQRLELIHNGVVTAEASARSGPGEIDLEVSAAVREPAWFALRAIGNKVGETRMETPWYLAPTTLRMGCRFGCGASMFERAGFVGTGRVRPAAAHTGPVYVAVAGMQVTPPAALVRRTLERLDLLESQLTTERLDELVVFRPFAGTLLVDGVPAAALRRDRQTLRGLIDSARAHYRALLTDGRIPDVSAR
jgi:hypothetical protein